MISQLIGCTFTDLSQYDVGFFPPFFLLRATWYCWLPMSPQPTLTPMPSQHYCCSLRWLLTPFLCCCLFLPTRRASQLSLSGCVSLLLIQSTHSAPAELQTNTALSTGDTLRSALPFRKHLIFSFSDPFFSMGDTHLQGFWPARVTEVVSLTAP